VIGYEGASRYARLIQALTGDDEIVPPGLLLEVDRPEYSILKNEQLWSLAVRTAASAGNYSFVGIVCNQPQSIVVITKTIVFNQNGSNQPFKVGLVQGPFDSNGITHTRDTRRGTSISLFVTRQQATQYLTGEDSFNVFTGGPPLVLDFPVVLTNTFGWAIQTANQNQIASGLFVGYERSIRPEETFQ